MIYKFYKLMKNKKTVLISEKLNFCLVHPYSLDPFDNLFNSENYVKNVCFYDWDTIFD